ncbi:hypothetical protein AB6A40_003544 [Gnathostoma spinigerum]|uniref:phospholipase A2 n=1 Tax=Gnathostoma spinigerum TaxID=75299 RepID=A0ABD6E9W0_9BILA
MTENEAKRSNREVPNSLMASCSKETDEIPELSEQHSVGTTDNATNTSTTSISQCFARLMPLTIRKVPLYSRATSTVVKDVSSLKCSSTNVDEHIGQQSAVSTSSLESPTDHTLECLLFSDSSVEKGSSRESVSTHLKTAEEPASLMNSANESNLAAADEEGIPTPPSSPDPSTQQTLPSSFFFRNNRSRQAASSSMFMEVTNKLSDVLSTVREKVFGEDYWIPNDSNEVAVFPQEMLASHTEVFRHKETCPIFVVQGSLKQKPNEPLYHVLFAKAEGSVQRTLSMFRTDSLQESIDLCSRCSDCELLFTLLDIEKDNRKQVRSLIQAIRSHPLWHVVPIAIVTNRIDLFADEVLTTIDDYLNIICRVPVQPEGRYPLMIAIEMGREAIVKRLLELGADPSIRDIAGNNSLHYAAMYSVNMLELLWVVGPHHPPTALLNETNSDGYTPVVLSIRGANPRGLSWLLVHGAQMRVTGSPQSPIFEAMQNSKSREVVWTLLEASPDLIHDVDPITGNTVLHVAANKAPLLALLMKSHQKLDLNAYNYAGLAPLHLYVSKGDIGLVMTLASFNCDMNVAASASGDTALHLAVSRYDLVMTRLLLCLGANPNVKNKHGVSPRHLAAKLKKHDLLASLIICGAERCEEYSKNSCVAGCINLKKVDSTVKDSSNVDNGQSNSALTRKYVQLIDGDIETEDAHDRPKLLDFKQQYCYESALRCADIERKTAEFSSRINLLSLDGGGIRGLVIAQLLIDLEAVMGEPIFPYFDMVAGTSTGGLIAAALAQGKTLRECQHIYLRFKDRVFDGWSRPYDTTIFEQFIRDEIGTTTTLADIPWPLLVLTTVQADKFPVRLEFMRNFQLPLSKADNDELGYKEPSETLLWKALRRTSAAPTYFTSVDNKYIDGGIISNNPSLDLIKEVVMWNETQHLLTNKPEESLRIGTILSVGTGVIPSVSLNALDVEPSANPLTSALALKNLGFILVDQVTATEGAPVERARAWAHQMVVPFFRLSAPLSKDVAMDTRDDFILAEMMWNCAEYSRKMRPELERISVLLKKSGYAVHRRHLFEGQRTSIEPCKVSPRQLEDGTTTAASDGRISESVTDANPLEWHS